MVGFGKLKIRKEFIALFLVMILASAVLTAFTGFNKVETKKVFVYSKEEVLNDIYKKDYIQRLNEYNNAFINNHKSNICEIVITPGHGNTTSYILTFKYNNRDAEQVAVLNLVSEYKGGLEKMEGVYAATVSSQDTFDISYYIALLFRVLGIALYLISLVLLTNRTGLKNRLMKPLVFALSIAGIAFNFLFILTAFYLAGSLVLSLMEKNREDAKFIAGVFSAAVLLRLVGTALMLAYNISNFHSLFAYVQPDEINYYNTALRISGSILSGAVPDVEKIVGFQQFGYNVFLAFVNLINGEVFFASKIVNTLVSSFMAMLTYIFVKEFFGSKEAKLAGFFICFMPTMIMFSAYTLRDVMIVMLLMLILYLSMRKRKLTAGTVLLLLVSIVSLWYLRNYAVLIAAMAVILFWVLAFADKKRINPLVVAGVLAAGAFIFFEITARVYNFNTFNTIYNYFRTTTALRFTAEFFMSLVNLDFLVNSGGASYGRSTILRMFYPDTLFLIVTFPFFVLGIMKGFKANRCVTLSLLLLFPVFIILYKIYYGGWFLRTQIQVLPVQAAFISLGIIDAFGEKYDKALLWLEKRFGRFKPKIFESIS